MPETLTVTSANAADWANIGPLYEAWAEDGPVIRRPDHAPVVVAETPSGHLFLYDAPGLVTMEDAERLAARVERARRITLDYWRHWRVVYGSDAYLDEEAQMTPEELAGETGW